MVNHHEVGIGNARSCRMIKGMATCPRKMATSSSEPQSHPNTDQPSRCELASAWRLDRLGHVADIGDIDKERLP